MKENQFYDQSEIADKLKELGAQLRHVRKDQLMSLEEVSSMTRIQVRLLRAIEEGKIEILPEPIYIQGFIKRFANALDLNGEEFASRLPTWPTMLFLKPSWMRLPTAQLRPVHLYLLYVFLVIGAVNCLSSLLNQSALEVSNAQIYQPPGELALSKNVKATQTKTKSPQKLNAFKTTKVTQPETNLDAAKATEAIQTTSKTEENLDTAKPTEVTPPSKKEENLDVSKPTEVTPASTTEENSDATKTTEVTQSSKNNLPLKVSITVKSPSWVRIVADGKTEFEGILQEGDRRTWEAKEQLTIRAGNAGGVLLAYNEQKAEEMGAPSEVKEKTFEATHKKDEG